MGFKKVALSVAHFAKQHAPEIMIAGSIIAGGAALFFTAKGTMKLDKILDDHDERVNNVKKNYIPKEELEKVEDDGEPIKFEVEVTEEERKSYNKDLTREYVKTVGSVALAYAPAAGLAVASAALSIGAHGIMRKRLVVAVTALESVSAAFAEYRQRVKDAYGEEAEHDILVGKQVNTVEVEEVGKNGKTKVVKKQEVTVDGISSPFSRFFDKSVTKFWNSDEVGTREYNKEFLVGAEKALNLQLRCEGFVFLNDALEHLGYPKTPEGQLYGWLDKTEEGDGYISFGLKDDSEDPVFLRPEDDASNDSWLLDFNVDGVIVDKIGVFDPRVD